MGKILIVSVLLFSVAAGLLVSNSFVLAQATPGGVEGPIESCKIRTGGVGIEGCTAGTDCVFAQNAAGYNPKCGVCCLVNTLYNITDWFFVIIVSLAGIFIIIGAMNLLTSGGDPSKVTSGRQYIMYAAIGLIVGFLARAIPAIARLAVGVS